MIAPPDPRAVVLGEAGVRDADAAAQPERAQVAAAVEAAAVGVREVAGDRRVGDRDPAADAVDRAAAGLGRVVGERRALDRDDAVAGVEDAGAVVGRVVLGDLGVGDPQRADGAALGRVDDRAGVRQIHAGPGDVLDRLGIERVDDLLRVGDHHARVERHVAVEDRDLARRGVVDRRAAALGGVAGERRADQLDVAARDRQRRDRRAHRARVEARVGVVDAAAGTGAAVADVDRLEPHATRRPVLQRAAVVLGEALAQRQAGERHVARAAVDLEQPVQPALLGGCALERHAAVDDRDAGTLAGDRHGVDDVEVAGAREVLAQRRDLELERAGGQLDGVSAGMGVGLLDRRPQRAGMAIGRTLTVARHAVDGVDRAVDDERARRGGRGRRQPGEHHDCEKESESPSDRVHASASRLRGRSNPAVRTYRGRPVAGGPDRYLLLSLRLLNHYRQPRRKGLFGSLAFNCLNASLSSSRTSDFARVASTLGL